MTVESALGYARPAYEQTLAHAPTFSEEKCSLNHGSQALGHIFLFCHISAVNFTKSHIDAKELLHVGHMSRTSCAVCASVSDVASGTERFEGKFDSAFPGE